MPTMHVAGQTRRTRSPAGRPPLHSLGARLAALAFASASCVAGYPVDAALHAGTDAGTTAAGIVGGEGDEPGSAESPPARSPPPERLFTLDFADPLLGYEANANAWYSLNQAFGRLNDSLGASGGRDAGPGRRTLLALGAFYFANGLGYYSHEIAHHYEHREHGLHSGFELDFGDWSHGYPAYVMPVTDWSSVFDDEESHRCIAGGLNQNEFNCSALWRRHAVRGELDLHNAAALLTAKLEDTIYALSVGLTDRRPPSTGLPTADVLDYARACDLWNDIDIYTLLIYNQGIDLGKRDYFAQVLVADLLSWHTWESIGTVWRYLRTGERVSELARWRTSGGFEITPPLISCYLTPLGTFYDVTSFVNPRGAHPVMISIGTDVDFIGDGEVDRFRFGAQYQNLTLGRLRLGPFAYVNTSRAQGYEGASVGVEGSVTLTAKVDLRFKLEHSEGDVVENTVKGKDDGFGVVLGADVRF